MQVFIINLLSYFPVNKIKQKAMITLMSSCVSDFYRTSCFCFVCVLVFVVVFYNFDLVLQADHHGEDGLCMHLQVCLCVHAYENLNSSSRQWLVTANLTAVHCGNLHNTNMSMCTSSGLRNQSTACVTIFSNTCNMGALIVTGNTIMFTLYCFLYAVSYISYTTILKITVSWYRSISRNLPLKNAATVCVVREPSNK